MIIGEEGSTENRQNQKKKLKKTRDDFTFVGKFVVQKKTSITKNLEPKQKEFQRRKISFLSFFGAKRWISERRSAVMHSVRRKRRRRKGRENETKRETEEAEEGEEEEREEK